MNLKNKILLTFVAIVFAICLFNTSCFATTEVVVNDTTYTFYEKYDDYKYKYVLTATYDSEFNYVYICSNNPIYYSSYYTSSTSTNKYKGFVSLDNDGNTSKFYAIYTTDINCGNTDKYTGYSGFALISNGSSGSLRIIM